MAAGVENKIRVNGGRGQYTVNGAIMNGVTAHEDFSQIIGGVVNLIERALVIAVEQYWQNKIYLVNVSLFNQLRGTDEERYNVASKQIGTY